MSTQVYAVIGQEQDSFLGDYEPYQSLSGQVAQLGLWNRVLSDQGRTGSQAKSNGKLALYW